MVLPHRVDVVALVEVGCQVTVRLFFLVAYFGLGGSDGSVGYFIPSVSAVPEFCLNLEKIKLVF